MTLLAFNALLPQRMLVKYQFATGALPIVLMFASFVPLWLFGTWQAERLGISMTESVRGHPNGGVFIGLMLCAMVTLMLLGYAVGWLLNAVLARAVFGWPAEKVRAVYLHSQVPAHWLKDERTLSSADAQSIAKWEAQRQKGALRFIVVQGVLAWGSPMFIAMYVVPSLMKGHGFTLQNTLPQIGIWVCAGAAFGGIVWLMSEATYRKLKRRSEASPPTP